MAAETKGEAKDINKDAPVAGLDDSPSTEEEDIKLVCQTNAFFLSFFTHTHIYIPFTSTSTIHVLCSFMYTHNAQTGVHHPSELMVITRW